jgi:CDP-6-deoxy-D-xylo-4-hexulose-3-dehydrase
MAKDIDEIIKDCLEYINENRPQNWDWVSYSGPILDDDEYKAALKVILEDWSKNWLIYGKKAREFELEFPKYLGTKFGSYTNSGSSANLLAISSLTSKSGFNLPKGSKVLTPVVCFPTTLNPIIQSGLKPVFVDVTLPDLNLDLDQTEEILKNDPEIRAIVFAHVLGNPPDMDRVMRLIEEYDLVFIEDACDALGSSYDGEKLGSYGHISTCSFFPAHHMTTGEGGFVATNRSKLRKSLASFRDWGRACYCNTSKPGSVIDLELLVEIALKIGSPECQSTTYDHRYVFDEIGYNLKPLDIQAAIGLEQLKKLPFLEASRRKNFDK